MKVTNPYTGEEVRVPCRSCAYCRSRRALELKTRVDNEFIYNANGTALLVTLDYSNNGLPIYSPSEDGFWSSNRIGDIRYRSIDPPAVYYQPVNHPDVCFGHLCRTDVERWFVDVRGKFFYDFRPNHKLPYFDDFDRTDIRFRYFGCGEYGPTTMRPHYHIILWFRRSLNDKQLAYVAKVLSTSWTLGSTDVQPIISGGASGYVASYVTGYADLPEVLRAKSLRPFVFFSRSPSVGSCRLDESEVLKALDTGDITRTRFDEQTKSFVDELFPPTAISRYFPKCQGFGTKSTNERIRVYSYVANYVRKHKITIPPDELRLKDIVFPYRIVSGTLLSQLKASKCSSLVGDRLYWSYADKYASLVCYRYCAKYNLTPDLVLRGIDMVYSRYSSMMLASQYLEISNDIDNIQWYILKDLDFLPSLPEFELDLTFGQIQALERYNLFSLYDGGILNAEKLAYICPENDARYMAHKADYEARALGGVKRKKTNEYKRNIHSNRVVLTNPNY